jgi:hypothetical protein
MNRIKFIAKQKYIYEFFERPYSAKQKYPEWLRKMPIFFSNKKVDDLGDPLETVKKCMPFYDAMVAGYHIPLPCDVWVDKQNNDYKIQWSVDQFDLISRHYDGQMDDKMIHDDYDKMLFKFNNPWIIKTPKNWSCLFTHPIHQDDVPFKSFTGFVDTDKFPRPVGIPFVIKKDFEGLIPKGTPFVQVIPIKREKFISSFSYDDGRYLKIWSSIRTVFFDRYKKFFRQPKFYLDESEIEKPKCPFSFLHKPKD